ncbi:MAG: hypothetical protein H8E71_04060 [Candidatus Marinimicrobia bacterium]|nr:hypothetical protein [Candidatus Neomarinimicrobiota bacterium]
METMKFTIKLLSDTLPGSGMSGSAVIDSDVTADSYGIPFIPAKRVKGLLRESLMEVFEMIGGKIDKDKINGLFGKIGDAESKSLFVSDVKMKESDNLHEWLDWAKSSEVWKGYFQSSAIKDAYSTIRQQTKLENGIAAKHSLRTFRVLNKGLEFEGVISKEKFNDTEKEMLQLAFSNMRYLGISRNRGFGRIEANIQNSDLKQAFEKVRGAK